MSDLALDDLIAHRPPMRLLDRAIAISAEEAVAELTVRQDNPLVVAGRGMPAYVGLELMAQTIALIEGQRCYRDGVPPKIGFLLGCRRYDVSCSEFALGMRLVVSVKMVFCGGDMYSFEARICDAEGQVLATATLNVYAPKNPEAFLKDGTV
jgi:predicted hotdog family 3-hydroxylacyl-ACP dehydratase